MINHRWPAHRGLIAVLIMMCDPYLWKWNLATRATCKFELLRHMRFLILFQWLIQTNRQLTIPLPSIDVKFAFKLFLKFSDKIKWIILKVWEKNPIVIRSESLEDLVNFVYKKYRTDPQHERKFIVFSKCWEGVARNEKILKTWAKSRRCDSIRRNAKFNAVSVDFSLKSTTTLTNLTDMLIIMDNWDYGCASFAYAATLVDLVQIHAYNRGELEAVYVWFIYTFLQSKTNTRECFTVCFHISKPYIRAISIACSCLLDIHPDQGTSASSLAPKPSREKSSCLINIEYS